MRKGITKRWSTFPIFSTWLRYSTQVRNYDCTLMIHHRLKCFSTLRIKYKRPGGRRRPFKYSVMPFYIIYRWSRRNFDPPTFIRAVKLMFEFFEPWLTLMQYRRQSLAPHDDELIHIPVKKIGYLQSSSHFHFLWCFEMGFSKGCFMLLRNIR